MLAKTTNGTWTHITCTKCNDRLDSTGVQDVWTSQNDGDVSCPNGGDHTASHGHHQSTYAN